MRKTLIILLLPVLVALSTQSSLANKRVALIIGNSAYENISALDNPKNDADLMLKTLERVGFKVIVAKDATFSDMRRAIRDFGRMLRAAGKDAVGLFYYAGHGVQFKGHNYLIPLGAQISDQADLSIEAVSASDVLEQLEGAGNKLNLVILDSCRNNPFKGVVRSNTRGLSRITAASGTLVAFSAAPGQVAVDGAGENSPYTEALAKHIKTPNLPVEEVFKRVRIDVEDGTVGKQTPWEESSLRGSFFFVGESLSVTLNQSTKPDDATFELEFWQSVKNSQNAEDFEAYLKDYPQGRFARLARVKVDRLKRQQQASVTTEPTKRIPDPATNEAPIHLCDQQATHQTDQDRKVKGLLWAELERIASAAISACRDAIRDYPDVLRFKHLLGRALVAGKMTREGLELLRKAADEGSTNAMSTLGNVHLSGLGVAPDHAEALRWYRKAADKDNPQALSQLGFMYGQGLGVTRDDAESVRWIRKAVDKGSGAAMYNLGWMHVRGSGVVRDDAAAARLVAKALMSGNDNVVDGMTKDLSAWGRGFRVELQRILKQEGVYQGVIDGKASPGTIAAMYKLAGR